MERMIAQTRTVETLLLIPQALHSQSVVQSKNKGRNEKTFEQVLLIPVFLICVAFFGCESSAATHSIEFIDRSAALSQGISRQPLTLIVEIDDDGGLRLNKIETGTTRDMALLAEKLEVIFDDREKAGINEREVLIDPATTVGSEDFDKLVKTLADLNASPIRVIKNDP